MKGFSEPRVAASGVLVMGVRTGVGKTLVAATLANQLRSRSIVPGVFKPVDYACERRPRQGWVSPDAEILAHFAEAQQDLVAICPLRSGRPWYSRSNAGASAFSADWGGMWKAYERACGVSQVMIVEGYGGVLTPLDSNLSMADLAGELGLHVLLVVPTGRDSVSEALTGLAAVSRAGAKSLGVVLNRYDVDRNGPEEERAAEVIATRAGIDLPVVVPPDSACDLRAGRLGKDVCHPISLWLDRWLKKNGKTICRGKSAE